MNRELPRCERCHGVRFFRVTHVVDACDVGSERVRLLREWRERPVAVRFAPPDRGGRATASGQYETWVCRSCGLTLWYVAGRAEIPGARATAPCADCQVETAQLRVAAHEHCLGGFEPVRFTRGLLGREGFLHTRICERCGRANWMADDYKHLGQSAFSTYFSSYTARVEKERPCLRCGAVEALLDGKLEEYQANHVPVALLRAPRRGEAIREEDMVGHFALRLCRPCGSIEWYARDIDQLAHDPAAGIFAIGDTPEAVSQGGPYR